MRPPVYLVTNVRHFLGLASARAIRKRVPEATVVCHDRSFSDAAACAPFVDEGFEAMDGAVGGALGEAAVARHGGVDYLVSNDVFPAARVVAGEARGEEGLRVREACDALCAAPFELAGALAAWAVASFARINFALVSSPGEALAPPRTRLSQWWPWLSPAAIRLRIAECRSWRRWKAKSMK